MDFSFSEEQQMLRDQARRFFSERFPAEKVVSLAESPEGWDRSSWTEIAGLGWIGLSAPEGAGGAGMSFLDEAVILEEAGYALYPGPLFSTVVLAQPALGGAPDLLERVISGDATATLAWAETSTGAKLDAAEWTLRSEGDRLSGSKSLVPDAQTADVVVVAGRGANGPELWAVEASDLNVEPTSTMDPTRRFARIEFSDAPARSLVSGDEAETVLQQIRLRAQAAAALEAVGVAQKALDLAQDYAKERKQFDKPIGSYQAVSHQIADTYMGVELARSLAYWAAWCVGESDVQARVAAAGAKSAATEVAVAACERSIQVHGGVGFTWEHALHRYYKRAQWLEGFDGYPPEHRAQVAAVVLDRAG